jgi:hypothetical protein
MAAVPRSRLTGEVTMPAERFTPADPGGLTSALEAARDIARSLTAASRRAPLEAWLGVGCLLVVLWAVGWL